MKVIIMLLLGLIGMNSYSMVTRDQLVRKNKVYYLKGEDKVFTGEVSKLYENGKTNYTINYVDGILNGESKEWDTDGNLVEEGSYKNGKKDGKWISEGMGSFSKFDTYKDGKKDGFNYNGDSIASIITFYKNNIEQKSSDWDSLEEIGGVFYLNGSKFTGVMKDGGDYTSIEKGLRNGFYVSPYNGIIFERGFYKNGKRDGEWYLYLEDVEAYLYQWIKKYEDGALSSDTFYYKTGLNYSYKYNGIGQNSESDGESFLTSIEHKESEIKIDFSITNNKQLVNYRVTRNGKEIERGVTTGSIMQKEGDHFGGFEKVDSKSLLYMLKIWKNEIEIKDGLAYIKGTEKPYTGEVYEFYDAKEVLKVKSIVNYVGGKER